ncbi:hypothetical protein FM076_00720 [Streptomyces albus subsp. chlorinus]|uniref:hypothetical protein n=1 Tax=Streptomyces albus TaxID=1888 RepID=UPI0015703F5F|nr:hypothetical protein [Streptomyces albus]NSC19815.1 hypothetical protein [Streptomyces albus subsp. chlorinus]
MPRHRTVVFLLPLALLAACAEEKAPTKNAACAEGDARADLKGMGSGSSGDGDRTMTVEFQITNSTAATCDYDFKFVYTDLKGKQRTLTADMGSKGPDTWRAVGPGENRTHDIQDVPAKAPGEDWEDASGDISSEHLVAFERKPHTD